MRLACLKIFGLLFFADAIISIASYSQNVAPFSTEGQTPVLRNKQAEKYMKRDLLIPEKLYPADGATNIPIIPLFTIKTVLGAEKYEFQIAFDQNFSNAFANFYINFASPTRADSTITIYPSIRSASDYKNNTSYYWRVRGGTNDGQTVSTWSSGSVYSTTTSSSALSAPSILNPPDNAKVSWLNIPVIWNAVSGATNFQFQWSTSSSFSGFSYWWPFDDPTSKNIDVKPGNSYYLRIAAFNDHSVSVFSPTIFFTTSDTAMLTLSDGSFDDGSGADYYENGVHLFWKLAPSNATQITLSFSSFDTEKDYDFVTVYDGANTAASKLGKFSGNGIPPALKSSQGVMLIEFSSDWYTVGKGWNASYTSNSNPSSKQISDYIDLLSYAYKVPSVIIKALVEQESIDWKQFYDNGTPVISGDGGIGLTQVTPPKMFDNRNSTIVSLGKIIEGQPQTGCSEGFSSANQFKTETEAIAIDTNRLKSDWKYNLEIGVRWLVSKKVSSGGACDDASILENWYYPMAYFNGTIGNDPKNAFLRSTSGGGNSDWKNRAVFPYQECTFNIIAQKYIIPADRKQYFGKPVIVTLPGPQVVNTGEGHFDFVDSKFCFFDWATYFADGTVKIGNWGGKNNGCIAEAKTYSNIAVHKVAFGKVMEVQFKDLVSNDYVLFQNYPNPFNPVTTISYQLPYAAFITLKVFDVLGREVAVLVNEKKNAGSYSTIWDTGRSSTGIYFYTLHAGGFVQTKRMVLIK
ncbi:MAG: T9SS type A sorting domain-containing protein [Ignavibacteriales bacterium]|nr:T9SS type A sorting domain-containing protein [Ignavibacteriales bacterium]